MRQPHSQSHIDESRFQGTLQAGGETWHIYFLDVSLAGSDWIVECLVTARGSKKNVTIRCPMGGSHQRTAPAVIGILRNWLASGDHRDAAYLQVHDSLRRVA
jgi:hypothetical protein